MITLEWFLTSLLLVTGSFVQVQGIEVLWLKGYASCNWGPTSGTDGTIFCVDAFAPSIVKLDTLGSPPGPWGSAGEGDGQFPGPRGSAVDSSGRLFVADESNNRIQMFTTDETLIKMWGNDVLSGIGSEIFFEACATGNVCYIGGDRTRIAVTKQLGWRLK